MAKERLLCGLCFLLLAAYGLSQESCNGTYNLIGCYEEREPGVILLNDRSSITWGDIVGYMKTMACKCSKAAKAAGYSGFAMHYYGECYGRTSSQIEALVSKKHDENKCVGDQTYTKCDIASHDHCTGGNWAEAIYTFKSSTEENVDGGLGEWQPWTSCDKECGNGYRSRERNCDNPLPKGLGKDCSELGALSEREVCKIKECPVNGAWSSFSSYGSCSKVCGGGVKYRYRTCTNPAPAHGGSGCEGVSSESASCNTELCPDIISCSTKYTSYQTHDGGNMLYLDRHRVNCGTKGHILSMFHLQRDGGNMRYQYKCCQLRAASYCTLQSKTTTFNSDGSGNALYLDRHTADCGTTGFINDWRVERNSELNKIRYNYYCCNLVSPWNSKASCYTKETTMTDDGDGKVYFLDRQTVSCNSGYALSYIKLNRSGSKWGYYYRCCKVNY